MRERMMNVTRSTFVSILLLSTTLSVAQDREATCFFVNDFETPNALDGWGLGQQVERLTPEGEPLGEFIDGWTVGDATTANNDGYFPVSDSPVGNRFAMANDAAAPCNCDMADVSLTSPVIDLSSRIGTALTFRIFNENILGAGPSLVEVSTTEGTWATIDTLETMQDAWQGIFVDLSAYDGSEIFQFRFRWSDGGNWAGGFAVDDVCLRERTVNDLVVSDAQAGAFTASPFENGDQGMFYRQLPLSQAAPLTVSAKVKNGGTATLQQISVSATLDLNGTEHGPFAAQLVAELAPGVEREIIIATGWQPNATGEVIITLNGASSTTDDAPEDNTATGSLQLTGAGWDDGYSAMSCDKGTAEASVGGSGGFIAVNRMEIMNSGDQAAGISTTYAPGTAVGAVIRAILMDADYNTLDTSTRRALTQADIDAAWNGLPVFEAFSNAPALTPGDHYIGVQQLVASDDQPVMVAVSGAATPGRSALLVGPGFTLNYLFSTPMVRLHLAEVPVGIDQRPDAARTLDAWPVPAIDHVNIAAPANCGDLHWTLLDAAGRSVRTGAHVRTNDRDTLILQVSDLPNGLYRLMSSSDLGVRSTTIVVLH